MTQIFKHPVSPEILYELLNKISVFQDNKYMFDLNSFKKGIFTGDISVFLDTLKPYYFLSKQKYAERKPFYNTFTTIIRQICNYNKITYKSEIKYNKSTYNIVYYIDKISLPESVVI